jgi:beta-galactosidase
VPKWEEPSSQSTGLAGEKSGTGSLAAALGPVFAAPARAAAHSAAQADDMVSVSNPDDWVSLSWSRSQQVGEIKAFFTTGGPLALPASATVTYGDGHVLVPVRNLKIAWVTASNEATTLTFYPVRTRTIRLTMTSKAPGTASGFLQIAKLQVNTS